MSRHTQLLNRRSRTGTRPILVLLGGLFGIACSAAGDGSGVRSSGTGARSGTGGESGSGGLAGTGASGAGGGSGGIDIGTGGAGAVGGGAGECGDKLTAIIRDFRETHPDFERYAVGAQGIVQQQLGTDQRPVYAHPGPTLATTGPAEFAQWYRDVSGVNMPIPYAIQFTKQPGGAFLYDNPEFFPIDNQGFGNGPSVWWPGNTPHNYLFTTEIHTRFTYKGSETFTFRGDDDLWVFVNGRLAIDLGGTHPALQATVDFDALAPTLGLVRGSTYAMDIFHAERHTVASSFRIETNIECFTPVEPPA